MRFFNVTNGAALMVPCSLPEVLIDTAMASSVAAPSIPVLREPTDAFRDGHTSLRLEATAAHPVETMQATHAKNEFDADLYRAERVYGRHVGWERRMDVAALASVHRLPGLPSSFSGLDTFLGRDARIGFEDTLNAPELRPDIPRLSVHDALERSRL